jgi:hypothetical protein
MSRLFIFAFTLFAFVLGAGAGSVTAETLDLASGTAWTASLDGAPARPIKVPGGGWNSDRQAPVINVMREVKDHVLYSRAVAIPQTAAGQSVKFRFGGVNYGAEVFLDGKKLGEHHGPQLPFEMDATGVAVAGTTQTLTVKAYHRRHYLKPGQKQTAEIAVGWDFPDGDDAASRQEAKAWSGWHGNSKVAYGIVRSIELVVLPAVHVEEIFVRPSVSQRQLAGDVWIRNDTDQERRIRLTSALASWNQRKWPYPAIPASETTIPARGVVKVSLGPVAWELGPESYWWPNIPFREDYQAQLHILSLTLTEGDKTWQVHPQRFGFVEHAEGPFYYTVNGVRITGFSDGTAEGGLSHYDSYGSAAAFLPPTAPGTGCPETWRRYQRIGINTNRLHCSPPTEYMMAAADETGFMLVPEAPIWGNNFSRYNPEYTPQTYRDLGLHCRNHPCVARYSLTNEVRDKNPKGDGWAWRAGIDDMRVVDDIHPLVYEMHSFGSEKITGVKGGHAWIMQHYDNIHEKVGEGKGIRGMGEHFWTRNSMGEFAVGCRTLRLNDWCYMAGWCWMNYWPNFLEGMTHDLHAWKPQDHPNRQDGIDGWGSPIVMFTQRSLHPYLLQDRDLLAENPGDPRLLPGGRIEWPYQLPTVLAGKPVERKIEVFNGGLTGNQLTLAWSAHWDKPDGPVAVAGGEIACVIEPGFHVTQAIAFTVPKIETDERRLYLVLESRLAGKPVFRNDETCLNVVARQIEPAVTFLDGDEKSQGDWQGKFGADGYELIGKETKLPTYARLQWQKNELWIYDKATNDPRALAYFANPPTGKDRIAAARYSHEVAFVIDVGAAARRLSLYFLDYDRKNRKQTIEIADAQTGQVLDKREIADFANGRYLSWKIQGKVKITLRKLAGDNACISGLFLDPAGK